MDINNASALYGKRSQDPYALCYLMEDESKRTWFQQNNEKTRTMDKTLDPVWNKRFEFELPITEIIRRHLVISIWDEDSTSRDDFMAGVRINLNTLQFWEKTGLVKLELQHQDLDGHVRINPRNLTLKFKLTL